MKKFWLFVLVYILLTPAAVVAQTEKPFVLEKIDNIVKVFYVTGGCHHLLVLENNEYLTVNTCAWAVETGRKKINATFWVGPQYDGTRIFPTTGSSYATVVKINEDRVAVRIYVSSLDVFGGSSTQKSAGKNTYRTETVEVLK